MRTLRQWLVLALAISSLVLATGCADDSSSTTESDAGNEAGAGGEAASTGQGGDAGGEARGASTVVAIFDNDISAALTVMTNVNPVSAHRDQASGLGYPPRKQI